MKTLFAVLLCLCMAASAADATAATADRARACTTIAYSANPQYPPYHWAANEARLDGASVELLRLVIPQGIGLKPVVLPWKRVLAEAESGAIDLVVSLRVTPGRSRSLAFTSHRSFPNPIVIFMRRDRRIPLRSWAELKPLRGGVSRGDKFGGGFDEYLARELKVEEAPTMENNFRKLEQGRIDYFVTGKYTGETYCAGHGMGQTIVSLDPPVSDEGIHFGFSKASPCAALVEQVSERLRELDERGVLEELLRKHMRLYLRQGAEGQKAE
jgi:polar amino acid transport system substrate-binding protein